MKKTTNQIALRLPPDAQEIAQTLYPNLTWGQAFAQALTDAQRYHEQKVGGERDRPNCSIEV